VTRRYADKAVQILNAWGSTLTSIGGDTNQSLAAGLYGYQFAADAEIMRTYSGWAAADFRAVPVDDSATSSTEERGFPRPAITVQRRRITGQLDLCKRVVDDGHRRAAG
jgi:hypothetical protein